jgi:hypothetical protein
MFIELVSEVCQFFIQLFVAIENEKIITVKKITLQPFVSRKLSQHFPCISFEKTYLFTKFFDNFESRRSAKSRPAITRHFMMIRMTKKSFLVNQENDERLKDRSHLQSSIKSSRCWMTSRSNFSLASLSYEKHFHLENCCGGSVPF